MRQLKEAMVAANGSDYRHSNESELLAGLRAGQALALAEAYHRTVAGVHAAARRLLGSPRDVEGLLTSLYTELWTQPPDEPPLEGWLRARSFALGSAELRARNAAPASPSLGPLLPELPRPPTASDALERDLADLDETERRVLVTAFDQGKASLHQDQDGAPAVLDRALRTLAGPDPPGDDAQAWASPCRDLEGLADWTLGLLDRQHGEAIGTAVAEREDCHARARRLRRGRRRLEGLPPPPDVGQRVLARVLTQHAASNPAATRRIAAVGPPTGEGAPGADGRAVPAESAPDPAAAPAAHGHGEAAPGGGAEDVTSGTGPVSAPTADHAAGPVTAPPGASSTRPPTQPTVTFDDVSGAVDPDAEPDAADDAPASHSGEAALPGENEESPPDESAQAATAHGPSGRRLLRRVVGAVVVLVVLGLGAAAGLAIGLVLVGGL